MFSHKRKILEGKAKIMFSYDSDPDLLIQHFKDDITANNNKLTDVIPGKGVLNNYISEFFMSRMENIGISTHFVKLLNMREQLVRKVEVIPLEVVVRNIVAGSLTKRLGLREGQHLKQPVIEFYLKNDELRDPLLTEDHLGIFEWVDSWDVEEIKIISSRTNDFLSGMLAAVNITLVDFKLEFGFYKGSLIVIDEISPDNCRLWDSKTNEKMDKDRFRYGMGLVLEFYKKVATKLGIKF